MPDRADAADACVGWIDEHAEVALIRRLGGRNDAKCDAEDPGSSPQRDLESGVRCEGGGH